jgi:hypothetical protein
MAVDSLMP